VLQYFFAVHSVDLLLLLNAQLVIGVNSFQGYNFPVSYLFHGWKNLGSLIGFIFCTFYIYIYNVILSVAYLWCRQTDRLPVVSLSSPRTARSFHISSQTAFTDYCLDRFF